MMETNPEDFAHRQDCQGATIDTVCIGCEMAERDAVDITVSMAGAEAYLRAADSIDSGATTKDLRAVAYAILDTCRQNAIALTTPNVEFSGTPAALSPEAPLERRVGDRVTAEKER